MERYCSTGQSPQRAVAPTEEEEEEEPRRRWEDNIKMDLQEVGCGGIDRIELAQDGHRWRALV